MSEFRILEASGGTSPVSESALRTARGIFAAAEEHDGAAPVSDQAIIGAGRGERTLLLFAGEESDAAGEESDADALAAGILGGGELDLVVRPEARGRGIGTAALAELLRRNRGEVRAWCHGENPACETLLARAGFQPVRVLLRMELEPSLLPDPTGGAEGRGEPAADGVALRPLDAASADDAREWVRVNAAAFASHPEQGKMTLDDFTALTQEPWFDADDLILAFDAQAESTAVVDGRAAAARTPLLGFAWVKTVHEEGANECELYALGVHPDAAGRGLGRLLLDAALRRMTEHTPARVSLYVDGDNERAVELYERAGFAVAQRSTQWLR